MKLQKGEQVSDLGGREMTVLQECPGVPGMVECRIWHGTRWVGDVVRPESELVRTRRN